MSSAAMSLFRCREFQPLAHYFAAHMLRLAFAKTGRAFDETALPLYLGSGLVCHEAARGNVCLNITDYAALDMRATQSDGREILVKFPEKEVWLRSLRATEIVGEPGMESPLILEEEGKNARLYLQRYWQYEHRLANCLRGRFRDVTVDEDLLQEGLARLFPASAEGEADDQKAAAENAVRRKFSVISGGPGTGKTTTVLKILSLLLAQAGVERLRVRLAAPTGKAAARLKEAVLRGKQRLLYEGLITREVFTCIEEEASTLHRLLGTMNNSVYFRHGREMPLVLDCLVVDEASMIDLAMMCKLAEALPAGARLILLGDMDQLSSVEAGAVFGDICAGYGAPAAPLAQNIVRLRKSFRFDVEEGIGRLSGLINAGKDEQAWDFVRSSGDRQVRWAQLPVRKEMRARLCERVLPYYRHYLAAVDIREAFARLSDFSILCGVRRGFYGAIMVNEMVEALLMENGLIPDDELWYEGRPVMVIRNDYQLSLFNGDVGIVMTDAADGRKKVFFESADQSEYRRILPSLLPEHESVFAMTVHKSQGSEFQRTLLLLPDIESEVLTRELIYTGITRARQHVEIWADHNIFRQAVRKRCKRNSGLREKLLAP
jgi:exodeoxyribonuclease V alpha subunit